MSFVRATYGTAFTGLLLLKNEKMEDLEEYNIGCGGGEGGGGPGVKP